MLSFIGFAKDPLWQIHLGLIDLNFQGIRVILPCCFLSFVASLKLVPAGLGIVFIGMSQAVKLIKAGSGIRSISVV
jgi:hypothetical protein